MFFATHCLSLFCISSTLSGVHAQPIISPSSSRHMPDLNLPPSHVPSPCKHVVFPSFQLASLIQVLSFFSKRCTLLMCLIIYFCFLSFLQHPVLVKNNSTMSGDCSVSVGTLYLPVLCVVSLFLIFLVCCFSFISDFSVSSHFSWYCQHTVARFCSATYAFNSSV